MICPKAENPPPTNTSIFAIPSNFLAIKPGPPLISTVLRTKRRPLFSGKPLTRWISGSESGHFRCAVRFHGFKTRGCESGPLTELVGLQLQCFQNTGGTVLLIDFQRLRDSGPVFPICAIHKQAFERRSMGRGSRSVGDLKPL